MFGADPPRLVEYTGADRGRLSRTDHDHDLPCRTQGADEFKQANNRRRRVTRLSPSGRSMSWFAVQRAFLSELGEARQIKDPRRCGQAIHGRGWT